jgi:hypothetical protein
MEEQTNNKRVRINLKQTSKGSVQFDITAEFETVAECEKELDAAVKAARRVMTANDLKEVNE